MSLDWSVKDVKDYEKKFPKTSRGEWNPVTMALVCLSPSVGVGKITKKNWKVYADRVMEYQLIRGPLLTTVDRVSKDVKEVWITYEDIEGHIGLHTNTDRDTVTQWKRKHCIMISQAIATALRENKTSLEGTPS